MENKFKSSTALVSFGAVGPHLLSDAQGPLAERLGLLVLAPLAKQHSQVVEGCSHRRVVLPQCFLSDG